MFFRTCLLQVLYHIAFQVTANKGKQIDYKRVEVKLYEEAKVGLQTKSIQVSKRCIDNYLYFVES